MRNRGGPQRPDRRAGIARLFYRRHGLALDHQPQRLDQLLALAALGSGDPLCWQMLQCSGQRDQCANGEISVNGLGCAEPAVLASTEPAELILCLDDAE